MMGISPKSQGDIEPIRLPPHNKTSSGIQDWNHLHWSQHFSVFLDEHDLIGWHILENLEVAVCPTDL